MGQQRSERKQALVVHLHPIDMGHVRCQGIEQCVLEGAVRLVFQFLGNGSFKLREKDDRSVG